MIPMTPTSATLVFSINMASCSAAATAHRSKYIVVRTFIKVNNTWTPPCPPRSNLVSPSPVPRLWDPKRQSPEAATLTPSYTRLPHPCEADLKSSSAQVERYALASLTRMHHDGHRADTTHTGTDMGFDGRADAVVNRIGSGSGKGGAKCGWGEHKWAEDPPPLLPIILFSRSSTQMPLCLNS